MSSPRFEGKQAIVTGAGSGIGRATARRLLLEGARVLGVDISAAGLDETFADSSRAQSVVADLGRPDSVARLGPLGRVDVLVNAAGILRRASILEHSVEDWEATLEVNVKAPYRLCREFARAHIQENRPGAIVNVCSVESFTGAMGHVAYTSSKAAILMMTRSFALELAPHDIRVNGVAPGVTTTAMNEAVRADADRSARLLRAIPMRRFGRPEDQAAAICFLASDEAEYVTGSVLPVDGGWLTM
jgi:2-deoxy-D-gluconate 3-dehydrogenase